MIDIIIFLISFLLIILLFFIKFWEINHNKEIIPKSLFIKTDFWLCRFLAHLKIIVNKINFKNIQYSLMTTFNKIINFLIFIKRHFDHKQSHFFIKKDFDSSKKKGSASFFLKDVSEYKMNLRKEKEEKQIKI